MTPITTKEVGAFNEAEETTSVMMETEVEIFQTSCLHKQKVDAIADKEHGAVAEVVLTKFITPTQTTAKNWF